MITQKFLQRTCLIFIFSTILATIFSGTAYAVILFGELRNSNGTIPGDDDITFLCYVDGTDDEIQTESTVTRNYQGGFFSVETQNFTPTPPATGAAFDIFFTNVVNGESAHFQTTVPAAAMQYPLITLAESANPAVPMGVSASVPQRGSVTLTWDALDGLTYRIYRYLISGGAYDRIATGIASSPYTDDTVDGVNIYYYVIVADDGINISGHSNEVSADSSLPVELSSFTATVRKNKVTLHWRTESELNNLGFNVFRTARPDGEYVKINPTLIKGAGTDATSHEYQFVDEDVEFGKTYYYYLEDVDFNGQRDKSHIIRVTIGGLPTTWASLKTALYQNYPNPFNPETWIPFKLAQNANVVIRIYSAKGQLVRTITLSNQKAGAYVTKDKAAYWDGRDSLGEKVASGVYFYTLQAGEFRATRKMIIMK